MQDLQGLGRYVRKFDRNVKEKYTPEDINRSKDERVVLRKVLDAEKYVDQYENDFYDFLTSDDVSQEISNFLGNISQKINKFKSRVELYRPEGEFMKEFRKYTGLEKTPPSRLLSQLIESQKRRMKQLSLSDIGALKYLRNLLMRWAINYHEKVDYKRIFKAENQRLLRIADKYDLDFRHKHFIKQFLPDIRNLQNSNYDNGLYHFSRAVKESSILDEDVENSVYNIFRFTLKDRRHKAY